MNDWREWIGHEEERRDRIEAGLVARWAAMLDVEVSPEVVPQAIHWCVGVPDTPTSKLGPDGHPGRDITSFRPPVAQPRRMWASSSVDFVRPLRLGEDIRRRSAVTNIVEKTGASGTLVFVDAAHETHGADGLAIHRAKFPARCPGDRYVLELGSGDEPAYLLAERTVSEQGRVARIGDGGEGRLDCPAKQMGKMAAPLL